MKKTLLVLALSTLSTLALAQGGESGNTNCNGQGNPNSPCTGGGNGGGAGGAGGTGGTGIGVGVGLANAQAAAAAVATANAAGGNARQEQSQGQQQSSRNRNTATSSSGGNTQTTGAVTVAVEGAKGDTYIAPAQDRNPVATAYAAPLTAANGTCMGSSSGGGQGAAIGISFATTWTDNNCDIRYDAAALTAAGKGNAAIARLCQKAEIKDAMEAAGTPCPNKGTAKRAEAILNGATVASVEVTPVSYQDPIIRSRLGLPPLK